MRCERKDCKSVCVINNFWLCKECEEERKEPLVTVGEDRIKGGSFDLEWEEAIEEWWESIDTEPLFFNPGSD